ncbi:hypothetical protein ACVIHC_004587 [Bradyrhizobium diazoefficiens]
MHSQVMPSQSKCHIFVDDSIHDRDGFVLTAAVIAHEDLAPSIAQLLIEAGLAPGIDEYKSHAPKVHDERSRHLRDRLGELLYTSGARIALAVTPRDHRSAAGTDMLALLARLKSEGALGSSQASVWLDDGLLTTMTIGWLQDHPSHGLQIEAEHDSKRILGLQLADLVAHTAATIIRCELGSVSKLVPAGPNSGYDPNDMHPLDFELWARLRHNLAGKRATPSHPDGIIELTIFYAFGLAVSEHCSAEVKAATEKRLGTVYLGCIH